MLWKCPEHSVEEVQGTSKIMFTVGPHPINLLNGNLFPLWDIRHTNRVMLETMLSSVQTLISSLKTCYVSSAEWRWKTPWSFKVGESHWKITSNVFGCILCWRGFFVHKRSVDEFSHWYLLCQQALTLVLTRQTDWFPNLSGAPIFIQTLYFCSFVSLCIHRDIKLGLIKNEIFKTIQDSLMVR